MNVGPYEVLEQIAAQSGRVVYRALSPEGKEVALKLLTNPAPHQRRRFQREITALTRLRHPHIVAALDAGEHAGQPYLVMEHIAGETLKERLARSGPLPAAPAVEIARKLALALQHAHEHNVLHRDVKPGNVILDEESQPRLTDFGLARERDSPRSQTALTSTGGYLGTPGFWPPEQAGGELDQVGPQSDVYSLGATLYACLTGTPPQDKAETVEEALFALKKKPAPPSALVAQVDPALDLICLRCLSLKPTDRYGSAEALAEVLRLYQQEAAGKGYSTPDQDTRLLWWGVPLLALLLLGVGAAAWLARDGRSDPLPIPPQTPAHDGSATSSVGAPQDSHSPPESPSEALSPQGVSLEGLVEYGVRLVEERRFQAGEETLSRALARSPDDLRALYFRGQARLNLERYAEASPDLEAAVRLDPSSAWAHCLLGQAQSGLEEFERALQHYGRALELDPELDWAYYQRGRTLLARGQPAKALKAFDRALELQSTYPEYYAERALAHEALGELQLALRDVERALRALGGRNDPLRGRLVVQRNRLTRKLDR